MALIIFIRILKEHSVSKHDYALCGAWSGSDLFAYVPENARLAHTFQITVEGADQNTLMHKLVRAFLVRMWRNPLFSPEGRILLHVKDCNSYCAGGQLICVLTFVTTYTAQQSSSRDVYHKLASVGVLFE